MLVRVNLRKSRELLKIRYKVTFIILALTYILSYLTTNYLQTSTLEVFDISIVYYLWVWIFAIQIIVFIPSFIFRTEHYYDLTGGITYISTMVIALVLKNNYQSIDLISLLLEKFLLVLVCLVDLVFLF